MRTPAALASAVLGRIWPQQQRTKEMIEETGPLWGRDAVVRSVPVAVDISTWRSKGRPEVVVGPDTPLRLADAVRLAFPHGGMSPSGLRREASRGRLAIEKIAGK